MKFFKYIYNKHLKVLQSFFSLLYLPVWLAKPFVILINLFEYILAFIFLSIFFLSLYIRTDAGTHFLTTTVQKLLAIPKPESIPGFGIELGQLSFNDGIRIENFALLDAKGVWLQLEYAHIDLSLYKLPLIFFHYDIDGVYLSGVNYYRIPETVTREEEKEEGWLVPSVVMPTFLGSVGIKELVLEHVFVDAEGIRLEQFPLDIYADIRAKAFIDPTKAIIDLSVTDKGLDLLGPDKNGAHIDARLYYVPQELSIEFKAVDRRWSNFFAKIGEVELYANAVLRAKELKPSKKNPMTIELEGASKLKDIVWLQRGISPEIKIDFKFDGENATFKDVSAKDKDFSLLVSTFGINVPRKEFFPSKGKYTFDDLGIFLATFAGKAHGTIDFGGNVKKMHAKTDLFASEFYLVTESMTLSSLYDANIQVDALIDVGQPTGNSNKDVSSVNVTGNIIAQSDKFTLGKKIGINPIDLTSKYHVDRENITFLDLELLVKDMAITSPRLNLDITTASGTTLPIFNGDVHLVASSLALLGENFPVFGRGVVDLAFTGDKIQDLTMESTIESIAFSNTLISMLSIDADITEFNRTMLGEIPYFEGRFTTSTLNYLGTLPSAMPSRIYDKSKVDFAYSKGGIALDIGTDGNLNLETKGTYRLDQSEIDIQTLYLYYSPTGQTLNLNQAMSLSFRNGLDLSLLDISLIGGRTKSDLVAEASFKRDTIFLKTDLSFQLGTLKPYISDIPVGLLEFEIDIAGATNDPQGIVNMQLKDFISGEENAVLAIYGTLLNNHLVWNGGIEIGGIKELVSNGFLPVHFNPYPNFDLNKEIFVHADWEGDIATYWDLFPLFREQGSGSGMFDINITDTLSDPRFTGSAYLAKGRFEDTVLNYVISDIDAEIQITKGLLTLALKARDGTPEVKRREESGTVHVNATLQEDEQGEFILDMKSALNTFSPIKSDDLSVNVSGTLDSKGRVFNPVVSGKLHVNYASYIIPQDIASATTVRSLPNVIVVQDTDMPLNTEVKPVSLTFNPSFNINITIPSVAQVTGFGLDSRWNGELTLVGDMVDPLLIGTLESAEGTFELLGKDFTLSRSIIVFSGNIAMPIYNVVVERSNASIETTAIISGTGSQMKISLTSVPSMPLDEIIAQTIYAKPLADLTQFEAVQVATYAGQLVAPTYNPLTMLASTRDALGLQVLRFNSTESNMTTSSLDGTDTEENSIANSITLEAGAYLSNQLYVGLERGLSDTAVRVEFELFPNINANARLGTDTSQGGILWKRDY